MAMLKVLLERYEQYDALSTLSVVVVSVGQMILKANNEIALFVSHHCDLIEWFSYQLCLGVCPVFAPPGYASNLIHPCRLLVEDGPLIYRWT